MNIKVDIQRTLFEETVAHYPWITFKKFKILYDCWRAAGIRKKRHGASFYTFNWRRGYLSEKDANSLRMYIGLL